MTDTPRPRESSDEEPPESIGTKLDRVDKNLTRLGNRQRIRNALAVIGVAVVVWAGFTFNRRLDQIETTRAEGRVTQCGSERRFQVNHNRLVQADQNNNTRLYTAAAQEDPSRREFILEFMRAQNADLEGTKVPVRRCPDGIAAFYESKGVLGCEPTLADPIGYCQLPTTTTQPDQGGDS